jgi:hypothetical protein
MLIWQNRQALMDQLASRRILLYDALRGVPEDRLVEPGTFGAWSLAGLCGHISARENRLLTAIQRISQEDAGWVTIHEEIGQPGDLSPDPDFDESQWRRRRDWGWREILNELLLTREEMSWTLDHMAEDRLFARQQVRAGEHAYLSVAPADIACQLAEHDSYHATAIWDWRRIEGLKSPGFSSP